MFRSFMATNVRLAKDNVQPLPNGRWKQPELLPVVQTPSKTHEKPLGLVFLIFNNQTKRAMLPNEITSMDTVKVISHESGF